MGHPSLGRSPLEIDPVQHPPDAAQCPSAFTGRKGPRTAGLRPMGRGAAHPPSLQLTSLGHGRSSEHGALPSPAMAPPPGRRAGTQRRTPHLGHLHQQPPRRTIRAARRRGPSRGEGEPPEKRSGDPVGAHDRIWAPPPAARPSSPAAGELGAPRLGRGPAAGEPGTTATRPGPAHPPASRRSHRRQRQSLLLNQPSGSPA
ncbi:hypothetical protein ZWY2020_003867 [Hordeum vulgare]|nr:hypothetical protein ZWY2020_003867 [Hordeum vulgare]